MENGERGEPRGIVKTEQRIWAMTSAQQRPLWRIFSTHSPSIRPGITVGWPQTVGVVHDDVSTQCPIGTAR